MCGLNEHAHCNVVRTLVQLHSLTFVCLHETKLSEVHAALVNETVGPDFDYALLPAVVAAAPPAYAHVGVGRQWGLFHPPRILLQRWQGKLGLVPCRPSDSASLG